MMRTEQAKAAFTLTWELASKVGMPILLGISGWTHARLMDHESRIVRLEAVRPGEERLVHELRTELREMRGELRAELKQLREEMSRR